MAPPRRYRVLGAHLRRVREEQTVLSLREAATAARLDQSVLSRLETGERKAQAHHLLALARAYAVPSNWLLLQAGIMEIPGFEELLKAPDAVAALDQLLLRASIEEKRELARHLAALRTTAPLIDSLLEQLA